MPQPKRGLGKGLGARSDSPGLRGSGPVYAPLSPA